MQQGNRGAYAMHTSQELRALILALLKRKGGSSKKMLSELGLGKSLISDLDFDKANLPSGDKLAKIASYLDVSVNYLLGLNDLGKPPIDAAREACADLPEYELQSLILCLAGIDPGASNLKEGILSSEGFDYKKIQAMLDTFKNETITSLEALRTGQNDIGKALEVLALAPDQREIMMMQFLDLPNHLQKKFLKGAIEVSIGSLERNERRI
jgi:transcriptional regulator with XRE-family HTH domain